MKTIFVLLMLVAVPAMAAQQQNEEKPPQQSDNYDVLYARYLKAARELPVHERAQNVAQLAFAVGQPDRGGDAFARRER